MVCRYELNNEDIVNELIVYGGMMALDIENNKGKAPMDMADCEVSTNKRAMRHCV